MSILPTQYSLLDYAYEVLRTAGGLMGRRKVRATRKRFGSQLLVKVHKSPASRFIKASTRSVRYALRKRRP